MNTPQNLELDPKRISIYTDTQDEDDDEADKIQ
jgi:hypothetical protein